jgi:hypothetical protein
VGVSGTSPSPPGPGRGPLLHFALLAALLVGLHELLPSRAPRAEEPAEEVIRVTFEDVERLRRTWEGRAGRPPTAEELDGLIRAEVREEALYREALALGLGQDDPLVRRVLVQRLETMLRDLAELSLSPTEEDLEDHLAAHLEAYRPETVIAFTQVYLDPERRGARLEEDAAELLEELRARDEPPAEDEPVGDPFLLARRHVDRTETRAAGLFGPTFASAVFALEPGRWHGPVRSGFGVHLVLVESREEFPAPALEEVRERVARDWVDAKRREIIAELVDRVLDRCVVIVEQTPAGGGTPSARTP